MLFAAPPAPAAGAPGCRGSRPAGTGGPTSSPRSRAGSPPRRSGIAGAAAASRRRAGTGRPRSASSPAARRRSCRRRPRTRDGRAGCPTRGFSSRCSTSIQRSDRNSFRDRRPGMRVRAVGLARGLQQRVPAGARDVAHLAGAYIVVHPGHRRRLGEARSNSVLCAGRPSAPLRVSRTLRGSSPPRADRVLKRHEAGVQERERRFHIADAGA